VADFLSISILEERVELIGTFQIGRKLMRDEVLEAERKVRGLDRF
jgi:hypothetical protein